MIAMQETKPAEAGECCCWCGEENTCLQYIDRQRVCRRCIGLGMMADRFRENELRALEASQVREIVWACGMGVCVFLALLAAGIAVYGC